MEPRDTSPFGASSPADAQAPQLGSHDAGAHTQAGASPVGLPDGGVEAGLDGGAMAPRTDGGAEGPATSLSDGGQVGAGDPTKTEPGCVAHPFALSDVTLAASDFTENRDRMLGYLRATNIESLLYNFRKTVGLSTNGATPPTSWEASDSNLRGHIAGHVLKALAQAYAGTGDEAFKTKADTFVAELKKCQDLAEAKGFGAGYLGAYPPDQFAKLEGLAQYPTIWAPYYTMHKILAGLIASYELSGNQTALEMAKQLGHWAHARLSKLPRTQLQKMWNLYIAGETGGMNEVLAQLHAITQDATFLEAAVLFDKDAVIEPTSASKDQLGGLHANQHIPTITGYLRVYDGTGGQKYLDTAKNFWSIVTRDHMYAIGGTGEAEFFRDAKNIAGTLTEKTAESCATYNMLKLTGQLFCHEPDAKYMDYYERGLYNHILGSQDPTSKERAAVTYFVPLNPGARRSYNTTNTCCHGTGMENHTKYQEQIYAHSSADDTLYVNLYIPSTLHWEQRGLQITQTTKYPYEPSSTLSFAGSGPLKVALRVPSWATRGYQISVNGAPQTVDSAPGTYAVIERDWADGDQLAVQMTFDFRLEPTPDDSHLTAVLYGPSVLVATSTRTSPLSLTLDPGDLAKSFEEGSAPLTFTSNGLSFEPFSKATNVAYHTYFRF
jgi:DUF1680 family protein